MNNDIIKLMSEIQMVCEEIYLNRELIKLEENHLEMEVICLNMKQLNYLMSNVNFTYFIKVGKFNLKIDNDIVYTLNIKFTTPIKKEEKYYINGIDIN